MNFYGETQTTFEVPGSILIYQADKAMKCTSLIGWGDTSAEFLLLINEAERGGGRSSNESRTVQVWWESPIIVNVGDRLEVVAMHASPGLRTLKANLMVELL